MKTGTVHSSGVSGAVTVSQRLVCPGSGWVSATDTMCSLGAIELGAQLLQVQ